MNEAMLFPLRSLWKRWLCEQIKKILSDNYYKEVNKSTIMRLMKQGVSEGERGVCVRVCVWVWVCAHLKERGAHSERVLQRIFLSRWFPDYFFWLALNFTDGLER